MKKNINENNWSPFDPKWYQEAFDKFINTADQLFNTDLIIQQGYNVPDVDGTRSSVFRNEAVLNNSFNEKYLRETLKDIYLNSSHKLVASNHDNTHFFQWNGHMSDMSLVPNTNYCELKIPTENFIYPNERDRYKLSQLYRRWIKVEDILNNWDVFKWHCMLFINQRIYSEYELRIDDHETSIRFKYYDHWATNNYPVYIYKFDTSSQCRVLVSKELCMNQWNWKMPVNYIDDKRVVNSDNIMVYFNKISDSNIRKDGLTNIEVLGDNIEFLTIKDGSIDLSNISKFNKIYIQSESKEWLWMSIVVPKFFHEYPILLPTDVVYRPYEADFQPVVTMENYLIQHVKSKINDSHINQVYVDLNGHLEDDFNGWRQMIRPIVLSDAFDESYVEPYNGLEVELNNLRDLTVKAADIVENFRFFLKEYTNDTDFNKYLEDILNIIYSVHEVHNTFLDHMLIEYNQEYEGKYSKFQTIMKDIKEIGIESEWLEEKSQGSANENNDFWMMISPLIYIPRELADKYYIVNIISGMSNKRDLWKNIRSYLGEIRFRRPIDESDFWTFEYCQDDEVWRPYPLSISRHFPDVYIPTDPSEEVPTLNRIFKTFFFYSDTMNVLDESGNIIRATASWDKDMEEYHFDQGAVYRDIFMEKFYWMGVRSIYKGLLKTKNRWETVEYVIDNPSYDRFNQLFLNTMDPYFKLGLATYLKSSNYGFPFDDAINKMEEAINSNFIGYKKITNFEMYLNKSWIPSYFDYITKIMDNWDYSNRLMRRPRSTFDITRLLPKLIDIQQDVFAVTDSTIALINWLLNELKKENYNINIEYIIELKDMINDVLGNMDYVLKFTNDLNLQIYSIDDVNVIIEKLRSHLILMNKVRNQFDVVYKVICKNNVYKNKQVLIDNMALEIDTLMSNILNISAFINDFDMEEFMRVINDLRSYFDHAKTNPDDRSLIGYINKFNDPWSNNVKEYRNKLFQSTAILYGNFDPFKSYDPNEIQDFIIILNNVKEDIHNFREIVMEFYNNFKYEIDHVVIDKMDHIESLLNNLNIKITGYMDARRDLLDNLSRINKIISSMMGYNISDTEKGFVQSINKFISSIEESLSYIAGTNNRNAAIEYLDNMKGCVSDWGQFIDYEEEVFLKLLELSEPPVCLLNITDDRQGRIELIIEYMNTVNSQFIPDTAWPTYSDVYEVTDIELVTGGFDHEIGEFVFVPHFGSYKITSVNEYTATAESLENTGYINSTFRDPRTQVSVYDSITNGIGVGITVRPLTVKHTKIINDSVITHIIMKIKNLVHLVRRDSSDTNSYNNTSLSSDIDIINDISESWNNLVDIYESYMSESIKTFMNNAVETSTSLIRYCKDLINFRDKININSIIEKIGDIITVSYKYVESLNRVDQNFSYYDNKLRSTLVDIKEYYGNGTMWSDGNQMLSLMNLVSNSLDDYKTNVIDLFTTNETIANINTSIESVNKDIADIKNYIVIFPNVKVDINFILNKLENMISNVPDLQKDAWYKIKNIGIAVNGSCYKIGDIVELEECDDTILLQIIDVEDGGVTHVKPLMDYAIPHSIWGLKKTKSRVGNGSGLIVDIYSYELEMSDSTLLNDSNSDIKKNPIFYENDMFTFKFENIHDLDINYEVFLGGKQITNFVKRRETTNDPLHPKNIDVLYINANDVMELQSSSIFIPEEHYFLYKIDDIEIKDPGAGYAVGQDIFVDANEIALRLKIAKLVYGPYKGIEEVVLDDSSVMYKNFDPSSENASVVPDSLNNIDDEYNVGRYDKLTSNGITKPMTKSLDPGEYQFTAKRFDNLVDGNRNKTFMYPDVAMPLSEDAATKGDPDYHWYQGSRIDNSQHPMSHDHIWNGIMNINPPTDPFIPDNRRVPSNLPVNGEYQLIHRERIHNTENETNRNVTATYDFSVRNAALISGDLQVPHFSDLPRHVLDYPDGAVNKTIIVEHDETCGGHRTLYRIRTFVASGFFVYDLPELADERWNIIDIDWMNCDWYPDIPDLKARYSDVSWWDDKTFKLIQRGISDGKYEDKYKNMDMNFSTYIHNLTVDDLSVFNWTTKEWEDLHDDTRWKLEVRNNDEKEDWGFRLIFLGDSEKENYSYDMKLYLNKIPDTQIKNASLKRDAIMNIRAVIAKEVNKPAINNYVNTGRHLRIRKLFPYEQKETFTIGKSENGDPLGYEMNFKVSSYNNYRNEIHLEDIKIYNKTAGRFENILDRKLFEVRFKDQKATSRGSYETQTRIVQSLICNPGEGFVDGNVWAWNAEFGIHVFGEVTADFFTDGHLITFNALHCSNPPKENISLEFDVYQHVSQSEVQKAVVMIEFITETIEVWGDGYIHNVSNKLAPVPKEFKVIVQYDLDGPQEYDIIISKTPRKWTFVEPDWKLTPTFHLDNYNIQSDRLYVLTDNGRFPLVNPSTGKPSIHAVEKEDGTDITFLNIYRRYEHLNICSVPYPMRSVYVQRRIPQDGYIDLKGKINKPLNKKYFEFWVNGKLLFDEVTIITPTKIFLHGLKSLKNLEIVEINRDSNEYFSDLFLEVTQSELGRPYYGWNYDTYLDNALEGTLDGDNYTEEEQEYLLTPVWRQVERDHPEFKNYPPNVDIEDDILMRTNSGDDISLDNPSYQFLVLDPPTLEGKPIVDHKISFKHFGFIPMTNEMLIDMMNEEWKYEIETNPFFPEHSIITDDEWYGMSTRLYDEYGILVHNLNEAAYNASDPNILRINVKSKLSRIVKNNITYDLD